MKRLAWIVLAVAFALVAFGCGSDDTGEVDVETTPAAEEEGVEVDTTPPASAETDTTSVVDPPDAAASEIADLDSGMHEGEQWIKLTLVGQIPEDQFKKFRLEFRTDEEDLIVTSWNVVEGGDPTASSFCIGETPRCPDGIFPFGVVVGDDNDSLVFFLDGDAFANSTNPRVKAFVETGATGDSGDVVITDFQGGERFPLLTDERDPC
jgi:hypothetical protein